MCMTETNALYKFVEEAVFKPHKFCSDIPALHTRIRNDCLWMKCYLLPWNAWQTAAHNCAFSRKMWRGREGRGVLLLHLNLQLVTVDLIEARKSSYLMFVMNCCRRFRRRQCQPKLYDFSCRIKITERNGRKMLGKRFLKANRISSIRLLQSIQVAYIVNFYVSYYESVLLWCGQTSLWDGQTRRGLQKTEFLFKNLSTFATEFSMIVCVPCANMGQKSRSFEKACLPFFVFVVRVNFSHRRLGAFQTAFFIRSYIFLHIRSAPDTKINGKEGVPCVRSAEVSALYICTYTPSSEMHSAKLTLSCSFPSIFFFRK